MSNHWFLKLCVGLVLAVPLVVSTAVAQTVRIFAGSSPIFAPVFIADQQGFFAKEGLTATVRTFTSGAEATEGFRSGAADFLVASDVPLLYLLEGGDTVMLGQFSANRDMLEIIGPKGAMTPADVKGKKIGLVTKSASEYLLNNWLKRGGLKLSDVERVHLAPFDQVPALARGDVVGLSSWKPFDLKIEQLAPGRFQVASFNSREDYVLYSGIVAKRDFTGKQAEATQKVMRALTQASRWLAAADPKVRAETLGKYLKTNAADVAHVIANNDWDPRVSPEFLSTMKSIEQFLSEQQLIKSRVNFSTAYDWRFLKAVDPALVP